jgi:hypothetical protein
MIELLIIVSLLVGMFVSHRVGVALGRRMSAKDEAFDRQLELVRNGTLALVAFLIGFAFSGAGSRYVDRADLVVKEANALGTAYLRADTIAEPERSQLKAAIREYTADRVALLGGGDRNEIDRLLGKVEGLHGRMWSLALKATQDNAPLMTVVLPSLNEVIDLHTTHLAMTRRHLPFPILVVLLAGAALSYGLVAFGAGRMGRPFSWLDSVYGTVLAIALWMVIDLDYPLRGIIQMSNGPLAEALAAMK